jgi:gliding motility-associated-like protein
VVLSVRDENITPDEHELVVAQSPAIDGNFQSMGQAHFDGSVMDGMLTSNGVVTMPVLAVGSETTNGQIIVYNAVSANGDDKNDYLMIENIENYPENKFTLFNRWGDKIFEIENYDNHENVFRGKSNTNGEKDLVDGTYFYVIETKQDHLKINGFLSVKN